jgi:hypothetical protein
MPTPLDGWYPSLSTRNGSRLGGLRRGVSAHGTPRACYIRSLHVNQALRMTFKALANLALCLTVLVCVVQSSSAAQPDSHPWTDAHLTPDQRAALLNRELTLDERITLVHGIMALPMGNKPLPPQAIPAAARQRPTNSRQTPPASRCPPRSADRYPSTGVPRTRASLRHSP